MWLQNPGLPPFIVIGLQRIGVRGVSAQVGSTPKFLIQFFLFGINMRKNSQKSETLLQCDSDNIHLVAASLYSPPSFAHCLASSTVIPLVCMTTLTPYIYPSPVKSCNWYLLAFHIIKNNENDIKILYFIFKFKIIINFHYSSSVHNFQENQQDRCPNMEELGRVLHHLHMKREESETLRYRPCRCTSHPLVSKTCAYFNNMQSSVEQECLPTSVASDVNEQQQSVEPQQSVEQPHQDISQQTERYMIHDSTDTTYITGEHSDVRHPLQQQQHYDISGHNSDSQHNYQIIIPRVPASDDSGTTMHDMSSNTQSVVVTTHEEAITNQVSGSSHESENSTLSNLSTHDRRSSLHGSQTAAQKSITSTEEEMTSGGSSRHESLRCNLQHVVPSPCQFATHTSSVIVHQVDPNNAGVMHTYTLPHGYQTNFATLQQVSRDVLLPKKLYLLVLIIMFFETILNYCLLKMLDVSTVI